MLSHHNNTLLQYFRSVLQTRFPATHRCLLGHQAKKRNMEKWKKTCKKTLSLHFSALKKNHNKVGSSNTPILWFSFLCCHRFPQHSLGRGGRNHRTFTQICLCKLFYSQAETYTVHETARAPQLCQYFCLPPADCTSHPLQLAANFFIW